MADFSASITALSRQTFEKEGSDNAQGSEHEDLFREEEHEAILGNLTPLKTHTVAPRQLQPQPHVALCG